MKISKLNVYLSKRFTRQKSIKDMYVFPPKPVDPTVEDAEKKRKEIEELNRSKQVAGTLKKRRLEIFQRMPITEPGENILYNEFKIPDQPKKPHSLTISLMGVANAGKSTLVNRIVGTKISAVSKKASTTRSSKLGITTIGNIQLCFYDTPGLVSKRIKSKVESAWDVFFESDLAVLVLDCVKTIGEVESGIFEKLRKLKNDPKSEDLPPLCLLLNKIDLWELIPEKDRWPVIERIKMKVPDVHELFGEIHQVSALNGTGIKDFEKYLLAKAKPQSWIYPKDTKTDQSPLELCHELVREKIFKYMNQEIPYSVVIDTIGWTELIDGTLRIDQILIVQKQTHMKLLIGKGGRSIQTIKEESKQDLQVAFNRPVILSFEIKVSKYYNIPEDEEELFY